MKAKIRFRLAMILLVASLSTGCASIEMIGAEPIHTVPASKAVVTFVLPILFAGNGVTIDLWDGPHFIGVLKARTIVQYEATPGDHLFMAKAGENWSYASGNVAEGKRYYLKANIFPGFLANRVALGIAGKTDGRIDQWMALKARAPVEAERAKFELSKQPDVQKRIESFRSGEVRLFARITDEQAF